MATQERLTGALQVVVNLTRCVALKRALAAVEPDPALNFWRVLHGNLLDIVVLEWCKLFGSDDEEHQQVHWKNVIADEEEFRTGLFAHLGIDQDLWRTYWQQMKAYRDQHVAHLDFNRRDVTHYPDLGSSMSSAVYYYGRLIQELRALGETRFPDDLSGYYDAFQAQSIEIAQTATASTRDFTESVH
ncbi:hypothetical protein [Burkholderia sp. BCC1977]|uniref:hypothetical protein n=1 Tax=Burkholderia sp. BCC1977 TaxID=2817440 RepID=UPI002ABD8467|nr:hypothetical protein [Burkholderia sp. BCC1977]